MERNRICKYCGKSFWTRRPEQLYCSRSCANSVSGQSRGQKIAAKPTVSVWACGAGVDSTAIALLICLGRLPKPDYAIMADCGHEEARTWQHVREVLQPKLAAVGVNLQIIPSAEWTGSTDPLDGDFVRIPAYFRKPDGSVGKMGTRCNTEWKVNVARRWLRSQGVERCENWVGMDAGEDRRAVPSGRSWVTNRFPLRELDITRENAMWLIGHHGWPQPFKTSCYFCPQQSNAQWCRLRRDQPAEWEKAVALDERLRTVRPDVYLHRSCIPLACTASTGGG